MRYLVDAALCSGHAQCVEVAGHVYGVDDDGYNRDAGITVEVPPELEQAAREGARACPEQAIRVLRNTEPSSEGPA